MDQRYGDALPVFGVTGVPWPTEALWKEAQAAFRRSLGRHAARLAPACRHAEALAHNLDCLADLFDQLAAVTCAVCPQPCCQHAKVWLNWRDLLFIHLNGEILPPRQLRSEQTEPCRYLGPRGCLLPHRSRPWICTWYVCPLLKAALERDIPGGWGQAVALNNRVKTGRAAMEAAFLEAMGGSGRWVSGALRVGPAPSGKDC